MRRSKADYDGPNAANALRATQCHARSNAMQNRPRDDSKAHLHDPTTEALPNTQRALRARSCIGQVTCRDLQLSTFPTAYRDFVRWP